MADNVYKKLQAARVALQGMKLKESGENKFAGYKYMELGDFLPQINSLCLEHGLFGKISFGTETAELTIYNVDKPEESISFLSPMSTAELKGCHAIQNLGAVQSYLRRYLWMAAFEIVEHDALDGTTGKGEQKKPAAPQQEPKKPELSDAQKHLDAELDAYCLENNLFPADVLKEVSHYKTDKGEGFLQLEDIKKPNTSDKFQRWVGSALGKLRDKVKETKENA